MPTFGKTAAGASNNFYGTNYKTAHGPYTLTEYGIVERLSLYLRPNAGGTVVIKPLIYADSSGDPGALVAIGPEVALAVPSDGWYDLPFSPLVPLVAGSYHLGYIIGTPGFQWYETYDVNGGGANRYQYSADSYTDGPTDPFGAPDGVLDWDAAIYATYTLPRLVPRDPALHFQL